MSSMTFSQRQFIPTPPEKGSFPLDHEGVCKPFMTKYMKCLLSNDNNNSECREESRAYLACRMDHQLMAKEEWHKLGYDTSSSKQT